VSGPKKKKDIIIELMYLERKKINVLGKECFRAVLLKTVEGMRDRWSG